MANWKWFSVNEVLKQLQDIPTDVSGNDGENSDDQEANDLQFKSENNSSSDTEDMVEPLLKRSFLSYFVENAKPLTSTEVNRGGTVFTSHEDVEVAEECDSELHERWKYEI